MYDSIDATSSKLLLPARITWSLSDLPLELSIFAIMKDTGGIILVFDPESKSLDKDLENWHKAFVPTTKVRESCILNRAAPAPLQVTTPYAFRGLISQIRSWNKKTQPPPRDWGISWTAPQSNFWINDNDPFPAARTCLHACHWLPIPFRWTSFGSFSPSSWSTKGRTDGIFFVTQIGSMSFKVRGRRKEVCFHPPMLYTKRTEPLFSLSCILFLFPPYAPVFCCVATHASAAAAFDAIVTPPPGNDVVRMMVVWANFFLRPWREQG